MASADTQSYEEMINALQNYVSQMEEECTVMESAGEDCVDNTEDDPAATTSNERIQQCVANIRMATEQIQGVAADLQAELDDIIEQASKAGESD